MAPFPYEDLWADVPKIQNENLTCPQCRKVHEINSIVVLQFNTDSDQPKDGSIDHSQDGGFSQEGTQELPSTTDPGQAKELESLANYLSNQISSLEPHVRIFPYEENAHFGQL